MELVTLKKTTKELEVEVIDENETILNPITNKLLLNKDVDYAACISDHPLSHKRRLYIRMKKGNPLDALKKTIKELEDEAKDFKKQFKGTKKTTKK